MNTTGPGSARPAIHPAEAQYRLLYSVVVAGKSAGFARGAMDRFLAKAGDRWPFDWVCFLEGTGNLETTMREARMGCYSRLTQSFREIAKASPDLMAATPEELEKYRRLEAIFIAEADRRGLSPRLLDAMIWEHASAAGGRGDIAVWPAWLQAEPAPPPEGILEYFKSFAA